MYPGYNVRDFEQSLTNLHSKLSHEKSEKKFNFKPLSVIFDKIFLLVNLLLKHTHTNIYVQANSRYIYIYIYIYIYSAPLNHYQSPCV